MNVNAVMEKVKIHKRKEVWEELLDEDRSISTVKEIHLPIEQHVDEIYGSDSNEKEKTRTCSSVYVNCRPESSWEDLISLLYKEDEMTAVDQARPFLPPRGT